MDSQATPYRNSQKGIVEKKRIVNCKNLTGEIKAMLIQKGLGLERHLTSQELVLFQVVFVLRRIDLSAQFQERVIRSPSDSKITEQEHLDLKRRREQYRRDKLEAAFEKLEEFLLANGLGNACGLKLTRVQILQMIRDVVSTLPTITLPPLFPNFLSSTPLPQTTPLHFGIEQLLAPGTPQRSLSSNTVIPGSGDSILESPGSSSGSSGSSTGSSTSSTPVSMNTGIPPMFPNFNGLPGSLGSFLNSNIANDFMMSNMVPTTVDQDRNKQEEMEEDEEIDIMGF